MSVVVQVPGAVLLLAGREQFTPPSSFGGATCAATADCVAVGVAGVPITTEVTPVPVTTGLMRVGEFDLETEGLVSIRDVYNREYESMGAEPGLVHVTVWADEEDEPIVVLFEVRGRA